MAAAICDAKRSTDSDDSDVCSACLKPCREDPKLLPCSHYICRPCLTKLRHAAKQHVSKKSPYSSDSDIDSDSDGTDDEESDEKSVVDCPACQQAAPGSSATLDVSKGDDKKHLALDAEELSKSWSAEQIINAHSHGDKSEETHCQAPKNMDSGYEGSDQQSSEKRSDQAANGADADTEESTNGKFPEEVKAQVKVMENLLERLKEEEETLDQQWSAVEQEINGHYAAALGVLAGARNECLSSLRIVGQEARDTLQKETVALRDARYTKLRDLSQVPSEDSNTKEPVNSKGNPDKRALSNADIKAIQERFDKGSARVFFTYKADDVTSSSLENFLQDYMGAVLAADQASDDSSAYRAPPEEKQVPRKEQLRSLWEEEDERMQAEEAYNLMLTRRSPAESADGHSETDTQSADVETKLNCLTTKYQALETENFCLRQKIVAVSDGNGRLAMEINMLKEGNARLIQDISASMMTIRADMQNLQTGSVQFRSQTAAVQWEQQQTRNNCAFFQEAILTLQKRMATLEESVMKDKQQAAASVPKTTASPLPQPIAIDAAIKQPLTATALARYPPQEQKMMLGERLFALIHPRCPDRAGKVTGMLLEMDNAELLSMLENQAALNAKIEAAEVVLQAHEAKISYAAKAAYKK